MHDPLWVSHMDCRVCRWLDVLLLTTVPVGTLPLFFIKKKHLKPKLPRAVVREPAA